MVVFYEANVLHSYNNPGNVDKTVNLKTNCIIKYTSNVLMIRNQPCVASYLMLLPTKEINMKRIIFANY